MRTRQVHADAARQSRLGGARAGFGVGTAEQFATIGALAEGVVIGSALIRAIGAPGTGHRSARLAGRPARQRRLKLGAESACTGPGTAAAKAEAFARAIRSGGGGARTLPSDANELATPAAVPSAPLLEQVRARQHRPTHL